MGKNLQGLGRDDYSTRVFFMHVVGPTCSQCKKTARRSSAQRTWGLTAEALTYFSDSRVFLRRWVRVDPPPEILAETLALAHDFKRPHHVVFLMLEDVAVIDPFAEVSGLPVVVKQ